MDTSPAAGSGLVAGEQAPGVLAEYRLPPRYRRPLAIRFIGAALVNGLLTLAWAEGHRVFLAGLDIIVAPITVYNGLMYVWRGRFRTRLTSDGIQIRGYFNHFVPWSDVRAVTQDGYEVSAPLDPRGAFRLNATTGPRARIGVARLMRFRGKSKILRAPLATAWAPDPAFEDKLQQIQELSSRYGTRPIG
jgi:hypothetical protein